MQMYEDVTIYTKELTADGAVWTAHHYTPLCFFFGNLLIDNTSDNYRCGKISVRIFTDKSICKAGDMIVLGNCDAAVPPENAFTITAVTDNFGGSRDMWHVKINAE